MEPAGFQRLIDAYRTSPIKRNVKIKALPSGPMPVLFRLGIQPNGLNVLPRGSLSLS
jgi:hypothetical protein